MRGLARFAAIICDGFDDRNGALFDVSFLVRYLVETFGTYRAELASHIE